MSRRGRTWRLTSNSAPTSRRKRSASRSPDAGYGTHLPYPVFFLSPIMSILIRKEAVEEISSSWEYFQRDEELWGGEEEERAVLDIDLLSPFRKSRTGISFFVSRPSGSQDREHERKVALVVKLDQIRKEIMVTTGPVVEPRGKQIACRRCRKPFVPDRKSRKYCSIQCPPYLYLCGCPVCGRETREKSGPPMIFCSRRCTVIMGSRIHRARMKMNGSSSR